ncbi:aldo/keto reductase [Amycolatopsis umgeniensis]|uniref:Aryl-alcohol dehydrogenase-like predicted oxidoreductase n=1 Tax=Amycolatopsis umgeniensis TaxID=336628 RepID=A0A841B338_9PSEU|nr:aldo/keto reductase [Amycolatopsis umgeniensis]MBB5855469.1 aryl-alcohol dehydrogenase-like predicted oxidoreductase [Amycolatopsis umgeniensis]
MEKVELGRTGRKVSQVSLGCMTMGTATDERTSARILDAYLDDGGDFLDTANCYSWWVPGAAGGESEELLGKLLKGRRDKVFLATKVSAAVADADSARKGYHEDGSADWDYIGRHFEGAGGDVIRRGVDESLRRLGTDHIDLYYIHVDDRATPLEETLSALDEIVRAGKVRHIGWSNVRSWRLERIRALAERNGWASPVAVQLQHSYLRPVADSASLATGDMLDFLRDNEDIALAAYSSILRGIYDDSARRLAHPVWQTYAGPDGEARMAAVDAVAREVGATGNQVALAWLLCQASPRVLPLIGPRTWEHYEAIRPAFTLELSASQLAVLDGAGS